MFLFLRYGYTEPLFEINFRFVLSWGVRCFMSWFVIALAGWRKPLPWP